MEPALQQARRHFAEGIGYFEAGRMEPARAYFEASLQARMRQRDAQFFMHSGHRTAGMLPKLAPTSLGRAST